MKYKKLISYSLPILAITGLTVGVSLGLTACSKDQFKTIFDKIKNAIHAIGSLSGKPAGQGEQVVQNTVNIDKIRFVLAKSFGVNIDKFNNSIQTLNLIPVNSDNQQTHSWVVTILLKEDSKDTWPKKLIDSPQNSANPNKDNPFYFATDKFLSFKVDTQFEKIVIDVSKIKNPEQFITQSVNKLNGSDLHDNSTGDQLNKNGLEDLVYAMSTVNNSFIPSSISVTSSVVKYTPINPASKSNLYVLDDSQADQTDEQPSIIVDDKYNYSLVLKPSKDYVFINSKNQIVNEVEFNNIEYNQIDITLSESDKRAMYKAVVYATDGRTKFTEDQLQELPVQIESYLRGKVLPLSKELLPYFKGVSYKLKVPSQEIQLADSDNQKELVIQFNFADNVNFKSFSDYKVPIGLANSNVLDFSLQTNKYVNNVVQTNGYKITLIDNSSNFFRAY